MSLACRFCCCIVRWGSFSWQGSLVGTSSTREQPGIADVCLRAHPHTVGACGSRLMEDDPEPRGAVAYPGYAVVDAVVRPSPGPSLPGGPASASGPLGESDLAVLCRRLEWGDRGSAHHVGALGLGCLQHRPSPAAPQPPRTRSSGLQGLAINPSSRICKSEGLSVCVAPGPCAQLLSQSQGLRSWWSRGGWVGLPQRGMRLGL